MKYLLLSVEYKGAGVTIHRSDKGNALTPKVLQKVECVFTYLAIRHGVDVVV
jgi:enoyl-CoA hydratase/carnithine racemase